MSPTLMARVDGLPVALLARERVFPAPSRPANGPKMLSAKRRARLERQTAAVHTAATPRWARALIGSEPVVGIAYLETEA